MLQKCRSAGGTRLPEVSSEMGHATLIPFLEKVGVTSSLNASGKDDLEGLRGMVPTDQTGLSA